MRNTPAVTTTMVIASASREPSVPPPEEVDEVLGLGKRIRGSTATPASARMTAATIIIVLPLASAIAPPCLSFEISPITPRTAQNSFGSEKRYIEYDEENLFSNGRS
jgi:hypothetical protein